MTIPPVPTVLVSGFLGAGKTTLLHALLPLLAERGLAPYVLINDYRNAEVDASGLRALTGDVRAINGDCICCDSLGELVSSLLDIHDKPDRVVLIEANGTSDPYSLIEHVTLLPKLRERFDPLLQVTVVDAKRWQRRAWHNALERTQAETASHLVLTHGEEASAARVHEVRSDLEWISTRTRFTDARALADELSTLAASARTASLALPSFRGSPRRAMEAAHVPESSPVSGQDERHQLSHGFIACHFELPETVPGTALLEWLRALPSAVLRVKGLVQMRESPGKYFIFQRTDHAPSHPVMRPMSEPPTVPPCVVLIGVGLDTESLRRKAYETLGEPVSAATEAEPTR